MEECIITPVTGEEHEIINKERRQVKRTYFIAVLIFMFFLPLAPYVGPKGGGPGMGYRIGYWPSISYYICFYAIILGLLYYYIIFKFRRDRISQNKIILRTRISKVKTNSYRKLIITTSNEQYKTFDFDTICKYEVGMEIEIHFLERSKFVLKHDRII